MNAPTFTKEEWEIALEDKGTPVELTDAQKTMINVLEGKLAEAQEVIKSLDLCLRLAKAGVNINYEFSDERSSVEEMINSGLSQFSIQDALESIVVQ